MVPLQGSLSHALRHAHSKADEAIALTAVLETRHWDACFSWVICVPSRGLSKISTSRGSPSSRYGRARMPGASTR